MGILSHNNRKKRDISVKGVFSNRRGNSGILFNHLPIHLIKAANFAKSESDFWVKLAQLDKSDKSITHDKQIFRKVRAESIEPEELYEYFELENKGIRLPEYKSLDPNECIGWSQIKSLLAGIAPTALGKSKRLSNYWPFIDQHCELEKALFSASNNTQSITCITDFMQKWLLVKSFNATSPTKTQDIDYLISLTMYWGAILELGFKLEFTDSKQSLLSSILPKSINKKHASELITSSQQFLDLFKINWGKEQNYINISWHQLYKDIYKSQKQDPGLMTTPLPANDISFVDPDVEFIKKRFARWKAGQLFTLDDFRKFIIILRVSYKETEADSTASIYLLINFFTLIQIELIKSGYSPEVIAKGFSHYPRYEELVIRRYNNFCLTSSLSP